MSDDQQMTGATVADPSDTNLVIPSDVRQNFRNLVQLIERSDSMNDEERQYWIDVLPVMTEDQIQNLREILGNEQEQIKAANEEYEGGVKEDTRTFGVQFDQAKYEEKRKVWRQMEAKHESEEKQDEEALLQEIESMDI